MNKKILPFIALAGALLAIVIALVLAIKPGGNNDGKLTITVSASFWGDIARQIGGEHVTVTSVLDDPEADPHLYESGAKDTSAITRADVVIINGLGYDDFMQKALDTARGGSREVITVSDLLKLSTGSNPHIWYDIPNIHLVAGALEAAMSKRDPTHSADYKKNLSIFVDSLQPLLVRIDSIRAEHANAQVAFTERVPEYLLKAANLNVVSPASFAAAIEEGNEPSPSDQASMRDLITGKKIEALIYNPQAESEVTRQLRDLASQNKIPVVAMSETPPANTSYQQWQLDMLDSLFNALNN